MRKGVINVVEVLVLLLIFLGAAALFASFYLNAVNQQAQNVREEAQQNAFLINPPVRTVGTIVIYNSTSSDSAGAGSYDAVPFACVEETSGSRGWWLGPVYLIKGYQGTIFKSLTLDDAVRAVEAAAATGTGANLTDVAFSPLTKLAAICYINGQPAAVYNLTAACDAATLNETVKTAVGKCMLNATNQGATSWKVEFVNVFQYVRAGGVGVVVGPIIPYNVVQEGASFSFKIKFAQSYSPNPTPLLQLKESGQLVSVDQILQWLETHGGTVTAVNTFDAVCESCFFSVG
ncbi:MAG: hypothetical protein GXO07_00930 [Crenarchaeota archaeon]|nr:hypothetical protein [Thermoproteota archaeon]